MFAEQDVRKVPPAISAQVRRSKVAGAIPYPAKADITTKPDEVTQTNLLSSRLITVTQISHIYIKKDSRLNFKVTKAWQFLCKIQDLIQQAN